jgi:hypothetical protein
MAPTSWHPCEKIWVGPKADGTYVPHFVPRFALTFFLLKTGRSSGKHPREYLGYVTPFVQGGCSEHSSKPKHPPHRRSGDNKKALIQAVFNPVSARYGPV